jgi:hypothetical protein
MSYASLDAVRALIRAFEECTLPRSEWDHRAHLTVAVWYLIWLEESDACARMMQGIRRYHHAHGLESGPEGGYHETITLCWLSIARDVVADARDGSTVLDTVNRFVGQFAGERRLLLRHYSREVLFSAEARHHWVEPDLKPLATRIRVAPGAGASVHQESHR